MPCIKLNFILKRLSDVKFRITIKALRFALASSVSQASSLFSYELLGRDLLLLLAPVVLAIIYATKSVRSDRKTMEEMGGLSINSLYDNFRILKEALVPEISLLEGYKRNYRENILFSFNIFVQINKCALNKLTILRLRVT
jgi:hypothetical protein